MLFLLTLNFETESGRSGGPADPCLRQLLNHKYYESFITEIKCQMFVGDSPSCGDQRDTKMHACTFFPQ